MSLVEINFDGIVGPTHNYAGLSPGNLAATANAGEVSHPRAAALQGLVKMRTNLALGLVQGIFVPPPRPNAQWLASLEVDADGDPAIVAAAWSASAMWAANAATVSPAPDTSDGRCHLTVANLVTMAHRSHEWPDTLRQLRLAFGSPGFAVHAPIPACFGDEGAANHLRLAPTQGEAGLEIFVFGRGGGGFPARQHEQASRAVARRHRLRDALFVEQNPVAIAAGAFHNDVVAVANEQVLLVHELAFKEPDAAYKAIRERVPGAHIIVVPDSEVSLAEAISTYLFNAQLVSLSAGGMALIAPEEAMGSPAVRAFLDTLVASNGPIRQVVPVDVTQSMANGGGPACLRLRVVADPACVDARFLLDEAKADRIERVIAQHWPEQIDPTDLGAPVLCAQANAARNALLENLNLSELCPVGMIDSGVWH